MLVRLVLAGLLRWSLVVSIFSALLVGFVQSLAAVLRSVGSFVLLVWFVPRPGGLEFESCGMSGFTGVIWVRFAWWVFGGMLLFGFPLVFVVFVLAGLLGGFLQLVVLLCW